MTLIFGIKVVTWLQGNLNPLYGNMSDEDDHDEGQVEKNYSTTTSPPVEKSLPKKKDSGKKASPSTG